MRPPLRGSWWREGIWEARECSNLDGRGRPSSTEVFLEMAGRSVRTASGAALRRTAGGGCPHVVRGGGRGIWKHASARTWTGGDARPPSSFFNGGQER